ncbi:MAG TPA: hypothetical protein PLR74_07700 [Agriterribacter sp.]|nr:hypothetical protein [Agriterribacter sp.]
MTRNVSPWTIKLALSTLILFLGIIAVFAFKEKGDRKSVSYTFHYIGTGYSSGAVQTLTNWKLSAAPAECEDANQIPCEITVDESDTQGSGSSRALKTGTVINVAQYMSTGKFYVLGGSGDVLSASNTLQ